MCDGTMCPCNLLDESGEPVQRRPNPLSRIRSWWHRPVTDRLDRIEANTRPPAPTTVGWGSTSVMLRDGTTAEDLARSIAAEAKAARRGGWLS